MMPTLPSLPTVTILSSLLILCPFHPHSASFYPFSFYTVFPFEFRSAYSMPILLSYGHSVDYSHYTHSAHSTHSNPAIQPCLLTREQENLNDKLRILSFLNEETGQYGRDDPGIGSGFIRRVYSLDFEWESLVE